MTQLTEEQQESVRQIKLRLENVRPEEPLPLQVLLDANYLLVLLDSDSQAAVHGPSNLLRRLKDFLFENCDHSDRDRNYDWCPSCVMGFMEVVAQPSNADAATAIRDKCVDAIKSLRAVPRGLAYNNAISDAMHKVESLTLDQVKPEEQK